MEKKYNLINKEELPRGVWDNEPDEVIWIEDESQLPCRVKRHKDLFNLWGYIYTPVSQYRNIHLDIHLGRSTQITYREVKGNYYILGFHLPPLRKFTPRGWKINADALSAYKGIDFMISECNRIAKLIKGRHLLRK